MAEERDKWIELVRKLKELTESGKLRWHSVRPDAGIQSDPKRRVSTVFESKYKDHNIRLYETSIEEMVDPLTAAIRITPSWQQSISIWRNNTVLELVDENGVLWEFPNIKGLPELFETVKFQTAGVKEFIEAV